MLPNNYSFKKNDELEEVSHSREHFSSYIKFLIEISQNFYLISVAKLYAALSLNII